MIPSLLLTFGLPYASLTVQPIQKSFFQDSSSKTAVSFAGIVADIGYPLLPEVVLGGTFNLNLNSKLSSILTTGAEVYGKYYFLGGSGTLSVLAPLSPQQATLNRAGQMIHKSEPIWSAYIQGSLALQKFEFPTSAEAAGKIIAEDPSKIERAGTYFGPSLALGGEYSFQEDMRLGVKGYYKFALSGLKNLNFNEVGAMLTYSLQIFQ
jgi:hypothetical protein